MQRELNAVFNLDRRLGGESRDGDAEPVRISVEGAEEDEEDEQGDHDGEGDANGDPEDAEDPDDRLVG